MPGHLRQVQSTPNSDLRQVYTLHLESVTDSFAKKLAKGVCPFSHANCERQPNVGALGPGGVSPVPAKIGKHKAAVVLCPQGQPAMRLIPYKGVCVCTRSHAAAGHIDQQRLKPVLLVAPT